MQKELGSKGTILDMPFVTCCILIIHFIIHKYCSAVDNVLKCHKDKFVEKWKAVYYLKATQVVLPKKKTPKASTKKAKKQVANKSNNRSDITQDQIQFLLNHMDGQSCDYQFKSQLEQEISLTDGVDRKDLKAMARYSDVVLVFDHLRLIPPGLLSITDKS